MHDDALELDLADWPVFRADRHALHCVERRVEAIDDADPSVGEDETKRTVR